MKRVNATMSFFGVVFATALTACNGVRDATPSASQFGNSAVASQASPSELLYVLRSKGVSKLPYVAVLNAQDSSSEPEPIYTIGPNGVGGYDLMAVDAEDNFFVTKDLPAATRIQMFAAGQSKPSASCTFDGTILDIMVSGNILYVAGPDPNNTIEEYSEPFRHGTCGKPIATLIDGIAQRRGSRGVFGLALDSNGNLFDTYTSEVKDQSFAIDEFPVGQRHAKAFENVGCCGAGSLSAVIDKSNDLVETLTRYRGSPNALLGVFPKESKKPKLYYPLGGGVWAGLAFGADQTELFALNYAPPTSTIVVLGYDPKTGVIGNRKRTYTNLSGGFGTFAVYGK
jgi:hypothetical protein